MRYAQVGKDVKKAWYLVGVSKRFSIKLAHLTDTYLLYDQCMIALSDTEGGHQTQIFNYCRKVLTLYRISIR